MKNILMKFGTPLVTFCSLISVCTYAESLHLNAQLGAEVIQNIDLQADGIDEIAMFGIHNSIPTLIVKDSVNGNTLQEVTWLSDWINPKVFLVEDRNNDAIPEIALWGRRSDDGRMQLVVKNLINNQSLGTWSWPSDRTDYQFFELDDLNEDGYSDFSALGRNTNTLVPLLLIKDGVIPSQTINQYPFPKHWINLHAQTIPDIDNDGIPEVTLFGEHPTKGNGFLFIRNGVNTEKLSQYNWSKKWSNISFSQLNDLDGDGKNELALFGTNIDDGRHQLIVKKGDSKLGLKTTFNWPNTFISPQYLQVKDRNNDGIDEQAVFGFNTDENRYQLMIKNGANRSQTLTNIFWPNNWTDAAVSEVTDLTGDSINEFALTGVNLQSMNKEVQVRDGATKAVMNTLSWPETWTEPALVLSSTQSNSIGLSGNNANGQASIIMAQLTNLQVNASSLSASTDSSQTTVIWDTPLTMSATQPISFHSNKTEFDEQEWPRVSSAADGTFTVMWQSQSQGGVSNKLDLYARRFDNLGQPTTDEIKVNNIGAYSTLADAYYEIDSNKNGKTCMVWGAEDFAGDGAYIRCYAPNGTDLTGAVLVDNESDAWTVPEVDVAVFENGDYAVVYQFEAGFTTGFKVKRYDADGTPHPAVWLDTEGGWSRANNIQIDTDGYGKLAITWTINDINYKTLAMVIDIDNNVVVPDFTVGDIEGETEDTPSIVMNSSGDFAIAHQSLINNQYNGSLNWFIFDSEGNQTLNSTMQKLHVDAKVYNPRLAANDDAIYFTWSEYYLGTTEYNDWGYITWSDWEGNITDVPNLIDKSGSKYDKNTPHIAVSDTSVITVWDDPYREEYSKEPRDTTLNTGVYGTIFPKK